MMSPEPFVTIDQVRAFVELARLRNIRKAAESLHLSEEGFRARLLALERVLGETLYEKARGRRSEVKLTLAGETFLPKSRKYLEDSRTLTHTFDPSAEHLELTVAASQYVIYYLLIDVVRAFKAVSENVSIRLLTRTEEQISASMEWEADFDLAICAPRDYVQTLEYRHWFALEWFFVAPLDHDFAQREKVTLSEIRDLPLILFENHSTGRRHILEAFFRAGLTPRVAMEATSTQTILKMVESGLGVAIVPLLPSGIVTRGLSISAVSLENQIPPIETGIVTRRSAPAEATEVFAKFVLAYPIA